MTATTGSDQSAPVEYYVAELSGNPGGSDSGWMTDPVYIDTGLVPGTEYSYTVQMRDAIGNVGGASNPVSATTDPASVWTELTSDDFESGWGTYRDGGSDCRRSSRDAAFAHQGTYCARIRDNSGTRSSFYYTSGVDVATPG